MVASVSYPSDVSFYYTYYGMAMSVRPSIRVSVTVFRTFILRALTYRVEILHATFFL